MSWSLKLPSWRAWAGAVMCLQWVPAAWILPFRRPKVPFLLPSTCHAHPQACSAPNQTSACPLVVPARHPSTGHQAPHRLDKAQLPPWLPALLALTLPSHSNQGAHSTTFFLGRVPAKAHPRDTCDGVHLCTEQRPVILTRPLFCTEGPSCQPCFCCSPKPASPAQPPRPVYVPSGPAPPPS